MKPELLYCSVGSFSPAAASVSLDRRLSGRSDPWRSVVLNVLPLPSCSAPNQRLGILTQPITSIDSREKVVADIKGKER